MTLGFLKSWLFRPAVDDADEREERHFLEESKVFLAERKLNPERVGCPGTDFLNKLACHNVAMDELRVWTNHLSSCGECYREFGDLKARVNPVDLAVKNGVRRLVRRVGRSASGYKHPFHKTGKSKASSK